MISIFIESFWAWFGLGLLIAAIGGSIYMGNPKMKTLIITAICSIGTILIGYCVARFVDSDYKSVERMLRKLAKEIENDNLPGVKQMIDPKAKSTMIKAETNMNIYRVSSATFNDLEVQSNNMLSPPTADVSFVAVVRVKQKSGEAMPDFDGVARVHFRVELKKTTDSWVVTDKCEFDKGAGAY